MLKSVVLTNQKKNAGDFKCTMPPYFVIPHGLSTLYRCSLTADHCGPRQTKPLETITQGLLQPQRELYPIQTISTIAGGISSSSLTICPAF